jgi:ketosteroid isomerase-like protein
MKKTMLLPFVFALLSVASLASALPSQGSAPQAAAPAATPTPRPQVPPATGAMLDLANQLADNINKQDGPALQKMMADDAVYLDEDGHAPAVSRWITRLTTVPAGVAPKKIEISNTHGGMYENSGWVSFNYVITETYKDAPKSVRGTASLMARKAADGSWKIQMIHGALYQRVEGLTDPK